MWSLALGVAGFAAGFFGPMLLRPDANQGPMVGIFITGPGGALAGLILGALFRFLPVSNARRWQALGVSMAALVLGTLYFALPPPQTIGQLFEADMQSCQDPAELVDDAIAHWDRRIRDVHWAAPRANWKQDVSRMLLENDGVVLHVRVNRHNRILRHRKPWNANRVSAEGWRPAGHTQTYFARFAGVSCDEYESLPATLYQPYGQGSRDWPPVELSLLLNLSTIEEAPGRYRALAR